MIPVPRPVLEALALRYRAAPDTLAHFGGGRPESDGIVYAYPSGEGRRMLKVIAIPLEGASRAMRCFDERLRSPTTWGRTAPASPTRFLRQPATSMRRVSTARIAGWPMRWTSLPAPWCVPTPGSRHSFVTGAGPSASSIVWRARTPPGTGPSIPRRGRSTSPGARSGRAFIPAAPTAPSARRGRQSGSASRRCR